MYKQESDTNEEETGHPGQFRDGFDTAMKAVRICLPELAYKSIKRADKLNGID